jgi:hypothetical protein
LSRFKRREIPNLAPAGPKNGEGAAGDGAMGGTAETAPAGPENGEGAAGDAAMGGTSETAPDEPGVSTGAPSLYGSDTSVGETPSRFGPEDFEEDGAAGDAAVGRHGGSRWCASSSR